MPAGVDPGFDHNAGTLAAFAHPARVYRAKLDAAPGDLARAAEARPAALRAAVDAIEDAAAVDARRRVRSMLDDDAFRAHAAALTDGDWPVAVLAHPAATDLGTAATAVRLSAWTAAKQVYRHPDLRPTDYALVQRALDVGETFRARAPNILVSYVALTTSGGAPSSRRPLASCTSSLSTALTNGTSGARGGVCYGRARA